MDRTLDYTRLCRMMADNKWDFYTACCEVRRAGVYFLNFALEELDLDKLLILRENCLAVNALYCQLDFRGNVSGRIALLLKMARLADVRQVIPELPEGDDPDLTAQNSAGLFRLQQALKELGIDLLMPQ